ncbi:RNA polymerase sigma factor [Actinomadura rupiterrae]|uniref:RNA polymerase sigma factor n=1 Tax=Actinomadura rupiterrae TaxID=559627 RepID=UPI0020A59EAE|nr:hypothetical protein [Actinomadura rupiterrae]MCP2337675.1 DNA-directed RNA polymerase specialized sigma24 family protein [Actinomadura rupiterrae]
MKLTFSTGAGTDDATGRHARVRRRDRTEPWPAEPLWPAPDVSRDREILLDLASREAGAEARLYDAYAARLHDYAASVLREGPAADVVHDVLVDAARRAARVRDRERLGAWLYGATRARLRRRTFPRPHWDWTPAAGESRPAVPFEVRAALDHLMDATGPTERELLLLTGRHGLTADDLEAVLGRPARQLRRRCAQAWRHAAEIVAAHTAAHIPAGALSTVPIKVQGATAPNGLPYTTTRPAHPPSSYPVDPQPPHATPPFGTRLPSLPPTGLAGPQPHSAPPVPGTPPFGTRASGEAPVVPDALGNAPFGAPGGPPTSPQALGTPRPWPFATSDASQEQAAETQPFGTASTSPFATPEAAHEQAAETSAFGSPRPWPFAASEAAHEQAAGTQPFGSPRPWPFAASEAAHEQAAGTQPFGTPSTSPFATPEAARNQAGGTARSDEPFWGRWEGAPGDPALRVEALLVAPGAAIPPQRLRMRVLHTLADPALAPYRAEISARGGRLTPEGLPRQADATSPVVRRTRRATLRTTLTGAAAATGVRTSAAATATVGTALVPLFLVPVSTPSAGPGLSTGGHAGHSVAIRLGNDLTRPALPAKDAQDPVADVPLPTDELPIAPFDPPSGQVTPPIVEPPKYPEFPAISGGVPGGPALPVHPPAVPLPTEPHHLLQDVPQVVRDVPTLVRNLPQDVPQMLQDVPRVVQDVPETVRDVPKAVQDVPRVVQDVPKVVQDVPQALPEVVSGLTGTAAPSAKGGQDAPNPTPDAGSSGGDEQH